MLFTVSLAGVKFRIKSIYNAVYVLCRDYLCDGEFDVEIETTAADVDFERKRSAAECAVEGRPVIDYPDDYLETLAVYRKIASNALSYGAFLMHGAVVAVGGEAYLFTAPSGVGKTTHTRFWLEKYPDAFILNGDKPLILIKGDKAYACGSPWAGKEGANRNVTLPLKAVCALFRGKENRIERADFGRMFPLLIGQTYRPADGEELKKTLELLRALGERTRFYALACNLDPDAARVAKEGIDGDE